MGRVVGLEQPCFGAGREQTTASAQVFAKGKQKKGTRCEVSDLSTGV